MPLDLIFVDYLRQITIELRMLAADQRDIEAQQYYVKLVLMLEDLILQAEVDANQLELLAKLKRAG